MTDKTNSEQLGVDVTSIVEDIERKRWADLARTVGLIALGLLMFYGSTPFAKWLGESSLSYLGYICGILVLLVGITHPLRRMLFPYIDLRRVAAQAVKDPVGAGLVFLGMCFVIGCLIFASTNVKAQEVPEKAKLYAPILAKEANDHWAEFQPTHYFAGQVEKESCITLKHSKCWDPKSELKTPREQGVGFGQITRTERFDALQELKDVHPKELKEWAWDKPSLYDPKLQLRGLVLKNKDNYSRILGTKTEQDRLAMMLVAYNGGMGRVVNDRKLCSATKGCDSTQWFGHTEHTSVLKNVAKVKGYGKSFFTINREYPGSILHVRSEKYKSLMRRAT